MLKKNEIIILSVSAVFMALMIGFQETGLNLNLLINGLIFSIIILTVWMSAKKYTAHYLDIEIEQKVWEFDRYWISTGSHFKKPIPIGLILPLLFSFLSGGVIKFFAFTAFYPKALISKVSKRYGSYTKRYSNVNEWDCAMVAFYGVVAVMFVAVIAKFIPYPEFHEFAKISIFFVISNLIPLGYLDGMKLFLGSRPLYVFALILLVASWLIIFL